MPSRTDRARATPRTAGQRKPTGARPARGKSGAASYLVVVIFAIGYVVADALWPIPLWVAGLYLVASIVCFVVYAVDKSAAAAGRRRVPERTLHLLGIVGGWPGAIAAQQMLRHKTQKVSFRRAFWVTVVVNLIVFALFATPVFSLLVEAALPA
ncbi:DUF1294 domain-containing protein [Cryobacterium sp. AP23]